MNVLPLKNVDEVPPQPIGDFKPVDEWQAHLNAVFYGLRGNRVGDYCQTLASADYRLAHALAVDFYEAYGTHKDLPPALVVHEWGCGNGNLAACFLSHLKTLDRDGLLYPRVTYVVVDNNEETLRAALAHADLQPHHSRVTSLLADVQNLAEVKEQTVHWIHCNELWNDLPTKVMLRKEGEIVEEQIRPNVSDSKSKEFPDWFGFVRSFGAKDVANLRDQPPFLDEIIWEKDYQPVDWKRVPYRKTMTEFIKPIEELVLVPVNLGAFATIREAARVLIPGGRFTSFDAGTPDPETVGSPDKPCYSLFGGQYSFIINFALCEAIARHLGINDISIEQQKDFVSRGMAKNVVSLVDLLNTYPFPQKLRAWERDRLVLNTLKALSRVYASPYRREIDYPIREEIPEPERTALRDLLASLPPTGIPDTIAYLTEDEILATLPELEALAFSREEILALFTTQARIRPEIDYYRFSLVG
jgi:SAM-dependent methyltransferase